MSLAQSARGDGRMKGCREAVGHSTPLAAGPRRLAALALPVALLVSVLPAQATTICRWVDANGRTQLADTVPERYAASATCTDSKQYDVPPERASQAQARDRRLLERAGLAGQPASEAPPPAAPRASAPKPPGKRPARGVDASTDCATWRRLYEESAACFAPYRTVGGIKAEAFDRCRTIPSPDPTCGAPSN